MGLRHAQPAIPLRDVEWHLQTQLLRHDSKVCLYRVFHVSSTSIEKHMKSAFIVNYETHLLQTDAGDFRQTGDSTFHSQFGNSLDYFRQPVHTA